MKLLLRAREVAFGSVSLAARLWTGMGAVSSKARTEWGILRRSTHTLRGREVVLVLIVGAGVVTLKLPFSRRRRAHLPRDRDGVEEFLHVGEAVEGSDAGAEKTAQWKGREPW